MMKSVIDIIKHNRMKQRPPTFTEEVEQELREMFDVPLTADNTFRKGKKKYVYKKTENHLIVCKYCKKEFTTKRANTKFCCPEHKKIFRKISRSKGPSGHLCNWATLNEYDKKLWGELHEQETKTKKS